MEEKLFYLEHYSNKRVNQTITNACRTEEKPVIKELQVFCLPVLTSWFCSFNMPSSVFVGFGLCLLGSLFCFVFWGVLLSRFVWFLVFLEQDMETYEVYRKVLFAVSGVEGWASQQC